MSQHSTIGPGEWLKPQTSLYSTDGNTELRMQSDGKIAIYRDGECVWQNTAEQRDDVKGIIDQDDGNFCMYTEDGTPIWATNTGGQGNSNTFLTVQNDGNVVLYKVSEVLWASGTNN
ncbi:hypothetical protein N7493_010861 [Penicillium malachiteum]|uniref:Bulb-type lectin domain-containing protein n=1 Tax=Penicillium malachiteum TaxID=1324776 RepID=A0AAD6HBA0_9EURO|nr:hypothetical protein N7493_010861 [Penicillium malachiteum]